MPVRIAPRPRLIVTPGLSIPIGATTILTQGDYFILTRGEACVDQGQQNYEAQQRERSIAALKRRAAALGFAVMPTTATPA